MQRKVKCVGYIVSEHGAEADPEKTEKVTNWREPKKTEDKKRIPVLESKIDNAQDSMGDELEEDDEIVVTQTTNRKKMQKLVLLVFLRKSLFREVVMQVHIVQYLIVW